MTRECQHCGGPIPMTHPRREPKYCSKRCYRSANREQCREAFRAAYVPKSSIKRPRRGEVITDIPTDDEQRCIDALARLEARQRREDEFEQRKPQLPRQRSLAEAERL